MRKCDTSLLFTLEVLISFHHFSFYCPILVINVASSAAEDRMFPKTTGLICS